MRLYLKIVFLFSICFFSQANSQESNNASLKKIQPYLYENPDKAIEIATQLIKSETNIDKKISYYLYLSKAYTAKRNSDQSYKTLLKAQELLKETKDIKSKIDVLILIAIQYQQMELYSKSFETLDQVDALCKNLGNNFQLQKKSWLGKSYAIKGIIYKSQGNIEIALEKFFNSISFFENAEQSIPTISNISIVYYNIGYSYHILKNFDKAEKYFYQSLNYARKSNAQSLEAYALKGLAENYSLQNNPKKAIELLKEAKTKSEKIGDLILNEGIYEGLSENYLNIGNFKEYLYNNDFYRKIKFEREQNDLKSINSLLNNLEIDKNKEIQNINVKYNILIVFIISVSILFILFVKKILKLIKLIKLNLEQFKNKN